MLHTTPGVALLCAGLALDGLGWLWMQRLCRVSQ
jgi:Flp pilus assembly protein TadB